MGCHILLKCDLSTSALLDGQQSRCRLPPARRHGTAFCTLRHLLVLHVFALALQKFPVILLFSLKDVPRKNYFILHNIGVSETEIIEEI